MAKGSAQRRRRDGEVRVLVDTVNGARSDWQAWRAAVQQLEHLVDGIRAGIVRGDPDDIDRAVDVLTMDPWCYRSGYWKGRLMHALRTAPLTSTQADDLVDVVLRYVDAGGRMELRDATRLGRRLGGERLRVELRRRLHGADVGVGRRALFALVDLRRPRLTAADIARGRDLIALERQRWNEVDLRWHPMWTGPMERRLATAVPAADSADPRPGPGGRSSSTSRRRTRTRPGS